MSRCRFLAALGLLVVPLCLPAQMTVTGRVTSGDQPIRSASVSIAALGISTRTNAEGQYSFIIRAAQVTGQTVDVVARHSRSGSVTRQLRLTGGSVVLDFALTIVDVPSTATTPVVVAAQQPLSSRILDSSAIAGVAGPLDVISALAGRIPGLSVTSSSNGGSARMVFRGERTIAGSAQPLIIVDGIAVQSSSHATTLQQFGLGGLDYGTPVQDIALDDIATVTLLHGASAVPLYGSRAANGVVFITTKQGGSLPGLDVSAALRYSGESATLLPAFQNRYGQGLGGQFEFFDGQGGGINDDVDQSWGPALDGQPIAQANLTEPRRADVRHWLPHPNGVRDYFEAGRTLDASIALNATRQWASGRAALNARDVTGVTPNSGATRVGLTLSGTAQPAPRFNVQANLHFVDASADNRPGTGFDEINPVAGFTRLGRQVDVDALRSPIITANEQINWIYTTRNNPFLQAFRNSNEDARTHVVGGATVKYDIGRGLTAILSAGADDVHEERNLTVVRGWNGLYPTALGRREFSGGGTERQVIDLSERAFALSLTSVPRRLSGFAIVPGIGAEKRSNSFTAAAAVADTGAASARDSSTLDVTSFYFTGSASRAGLIVDAGVRLEQSSAFPTGLGTAIFPALAVAYDVTSAMSGLRANLGVARLRASAWQAGNEIGPYTLRRTFAGGGTASTPTLGLPADSLALPERTTGLEVGTELASKSERVAFDLTWYSERSRELLVAAPSFVGQTARVNNQGYESQLRATLLNSGETRWDVAVSFARNKSQVNTVRCDSCAGIDEVELSPSLWGATLAARRGQPLGVIVGTRYLRDGTTGALLLRNGLPIPDASGPHVLGSPQPDWTSSIRSALRFGSLDVALLLDARMGGKVFSATNLWGSYAGTLESTLEGRETGLLIAGIDSVTGAANADSVSAEDYFHSLAPIHEAWVYDASYWKLREARLTYAVPLRFVPGFREHQLRVSLVGRNLVSSAKAPNIDPETLLSTGAFQGFEMGQLPTTKSVGIQLSVAP